MIILRREMKSSVLISPVYSDPKVCSRTYCPFDEIITNSSFEMQIYLNKLLSKDQTLNIAENSCMQ